MRDPEEFPASLRIALDVVTINESPRVVGSTAFAAHRYPSDVDVFERVTVGLPRSRALKFYEDQFRNIMEKLLVDPQIYYMDFKAGEDLRFDSEIDSTSTITERQEIVNTLYEKGLVTPEEIDELYRAADDLEDFREAIRQRRVLRWTPEEVISGRKELVGNTHMLFRDALGQATVVKLDVVSWIEVRFQSIEVFYNLRYLDPQTGATEFYPLGSYTRSLLDDIERYSSRRFYSPLKLTKRLWSLSRVIDCTPLLEALTPLLSSHAAALNQIQSDAELLIEFVSRSVAQPKAGPLTEGDSRWTSGTVRNLFMELLGLHKRLTNHLRGEPYEIIHQIVDEFFTLWIEWQISGRLQRGEIAKRLELIREILHEEVLRQSQEFLEQIDKMNITCRNPRFREIAGLVVPSTYS